MFLSTIKNSYGLIFTPANAKVLQLNYINFKSISTSCVANGKRNFRQIFIANKRGHNLFRQRRHEDPDYYPDIPVYTHVRSPGYKYGKTFRLVPEMVPEFIVPDLSDCGDLKPYVSYRAAENVQNEFTAKDLFNYVYKDKIENDFKNGKLNDDGSPLEPSPEESMTPDEAFIQARKTGSDLFSERIPRRWECLEKKLI